MAKHGLLNISASVALLAVLGGCTTADDPPRTAADVMREHASEQQEDVELQKEIASDWDKAKDMIESGRNDLKEGREKVEAAERMMLEGQDQIRQGEAKIVQGKEQANDAKQRFKRYFPRLDIEPKDL